jgi:dihydroxyacetone kinase-like predicted kinase
VVVTAAGPGLSELLSEAGATVVAPRAGRRPSTGPILEAIRAAGTAEVVVLPNDRDSVAAAEAAARAAREEEVARVAVIPTDTQVQGLAALAVHEPGRAFEQDVLEMTAAARHARSGGVTVAAKRAMTTAGPCEPGDVLGVIEGDFVVVGADLFDVAVEVVERLLGGGGELVTIVAGADVGDLAERCAAHLAAAHPMVDVVVHHGGQPRYPLLLGVE